MSVAGFACVLRCVLRSCGKKETEIVCLSWKNTQGDREQRIQRNGNSEFEAVLSLQQRVWKRNLLQSADRLKAHIYISGQREMKAKQARVTQIG